MHARYPTLAERMTRSHITYAAITADEMLAAARRHEKYLGTVTRRDYEMRIFEDGSVFLRNTSIEKARRRLSLADVQAQSRDFWMHPHRDLWQHVLNIWF